MLSLCLACFSLTPTHDGYTLPALCRSSLTISTRFDYVVCITSQVQLGKGTVV